MAERLSVRVFQQAAGSLVKENNEYIFNYHANTQKNDYISLTMPVRAKGYIYPRLHPIFEMHLPEGYLLSIIKKHFAKLTDTDDFGLLRLLAPSVRGRVNYAIKAEQHSRLTLDDLLHPKQDDLFDELVSRFALLSPLSGVQPKVLAQVENKATLKLDDYIVKAWGPDYPQLALNEFFCMRAAKKAGIEVPEFYLSDDDALFIMRRFDIDPSGQPLGFEDLCVLQAKSRENKYTGSYEQIAKSIKIFTSPAYKMRSLQQFFKMMVLNNRLQNGDAHLKNFGLLYEDSNSIRLAPVYDVVSTTFYIKNDIAALTLLGSKKWWDRKFLIRFGVETCDLSAKQANLLYDECEFAISSVNQEVQARLEFEPMPQKRLLLEHLSCLMDKNL